MQHIGFIVFVVLASVLITYSIYLYGNPNIFTLGFGVRQGNVQTSTTRVITRQYSSSTVSKQQSGQQAAPSPSYCGQLNINLSQIPAGFLLREISPCFGKIGISASPGYPGSYSQITLYSYLPSSAGTLNITGWLMKGNRGSQYVPQAVNVYDPSGLSSQSDIYVKNGDTVKIYSNQSAIGVNLRLNKCIGYLANANKFNPPLYMNCPYVNRSDIINFSGQCQNYVLSLASCQMPAPNPPIPQTDYSCRAYLDNLNYGGCFANHRNDNDFLSNQWVAWSGSQFLDFQHDRLLLFDRSGLLVAEYTY
ncbi:MAG: hypothetical protein AAB536_00925 [Patescibacteria group bacterium]